MASSVDWISCSLSAKREISSTFSGHFPGLFSRLLEPLRPLWKLVQFDPIELCKEGEGGESGGSKYCRLETQSSGRRLFGVCLQFKHMCDSTSSLSTLQTPAQRRLNFYHNRSRRQGCQVRNLSFKEDKLIISFSSTLLPRCSKLRALFFKKCASPYDVSGPVSPRVSR